MNPNNEKDNQNGGLRSLNSAKNVLGKHVVCRDYVWGKCIRKQCKLLHECDINTMLSILQFCHDYQNSTGCKRQNCTFLHATREEEILFRETGQYPADLMERHYKMNMSREGPSQQGPPATTQLGQSPHSQQGPPMLTVNPVYQSPWFLLPPPPPPKEPSPPPQTYKPGPSVNAAPSTTYPTTLIDTSKPPPPLPQQVKNGSIRRLPEEEGSKVAQTTYQPSPSRPVQEMIPIEIDTSKPPPRLPSVKSNTEKRPISDSHVGPCKTRKIDTESTTCENCLQWDLRNLEIEKKKKDKLKEKAILVLRYEEKKKELADIVDTLKGLHNDNSSNEPYDLASMDLRYALSDPDIILQRTKKLDGPEFLSNPQLSKSQSRNTFDIAGSSSSNETIRNGQGPTNGLISSAAGDPPRSFPSSAAVSTPSHPTPAPSQFSASTSATPTSVVTPFSHPPPAPPQFTMGQSYRPANNQFNSYFPGPSNEFNNSTIPQTPGLPPYDQNMYFNVRGRPPPPFT
ncbi:uncharacterized protein LOC128683322 [Plodia interpunctella]|nr:uncharacterized protein LOC128683322 [Plodia interpunctella]XP_053624799.1 uncharacterized protein LOC128683322 [Plodia interpunctella]